MTGPSPKYPDVTVQLSGEDGNALAVIGRVSAALRKEGVSNAEVEEYCKESMSGTYTGMLQTAMRWVNVE